MNKNVIEAIDSERRLQERRYKSHKHTAGEWLLLIEQYLNRAKEEWLVSGDIVVMNDIRKITTLGVAAMEQLGAPKRSHKDFEDIYVGE